MKNSSNNKFKILKYRFMKYLIQLFIFIVHSYFSAFSASSFGSGT